MDAPRDLQRLCAEFAEQEPMVEVWQRVPDVDPGKDEIACDTMSARFAAFARARGVTASSAMYTFDVPFAEEHAWVCVRIDGQEWHVDWTARQFWNLEEPPSKAHADLPCPLIWQGPDHPVLGSRG